MVFRINLFIGFFILGILTNLMAQSTMFQMKYGGTNEERLRYGVQTNDAGFILAGTTTSFGSGGYDMYLIKTDYAGSIQWTKTYGGGGYEDANCVRQTQDGGYIVAGIAMSNSMFLMKTTASGDTVWTKTYGGNAPDEPRSVRQTSDGGYIVAGYTKSFGNGAYYDVYLMKVGSSGNLEWGQAYGRLGNDYGQSVEQTSDGGYIVAGTDSLGGGHGGILLLKTDSLGNRQWHNLYGGSGDDFGYAAIQTSDGGYLITGETSSFGWAWDALLVKTDSNGAIEWSRNYGGTGHDIGRSVAELPDGSFAWAGTREVVGGPFNLDVFLIKLNSNGDSIWTKIYGTSDEEDLSSMSLLADGGFLLSTFSNGSVLPHFYAIRTDASGNTGCNEQSGTGTFASPATVITQPVISVSSGSGYHSIPISVSSGGFATPICLTVPVENIVAQPAFSIFPNPVTTESTIKIDQNINLDGMMFRIYDIVGRLIVDVPVNTHCVTISKNELHSGVFTFEFRNNSGYISTGKFAIE